MNCKNCGAPLNDNDEVCQYCGTVTPHGASIRSERKRLEALENIPVMKYVSAAFSVFVYIITFGCYAPYWYATRIAHLNALNTGRKFPAWAAGVFVLAFCGVFLSDNIAGLFGGGQELAQIIFDWSAGIGLVVSVYLAFAVRNILQAYAAKFMDKSAAVGSVAPSGVMLVLFGPIYLQHSVNKMIDMKLLAPKI